MDFFEMGGFEPEEVIRDYFVRNDIVLAKLYTKERR